MESVGEAARTVAGWFDELLLDLAAQRRSATLGGHYGDADETPTVIVEPRRGPEQRLRAELAEPMVWQPMSNLRVVLRVDGAFCQVRG